MSKTPLRYRRINRRNGSIQKITPDNYASRKGIPSNTPLNVSPQRVFNNDFSPIQLLQFKEELGIGTEEVEIAKVRRKPKRPLNIEDILGGNLTLIRMILKILIMILRRKKKDLSLMMLTDGELKRIKLRLRKSRKGPEVELGIEKNTTFT